MATNTTNFDLVKPAGSDSYDISSFHNGSMDKIDSALQGLGTGLAIISKNNTHVPINEGEYVYIHGHGSLAEGLYKATMNIVNNGTLNNSCVTPVSGGLGKQVATLSDQIANNTVHKEESLGASQLTSTTAILNYAPGMYKITDPSSANFPFQYGTAVIFKTIDGYGMVLAKRAQSGDMYVRHFNGTSWQDSTWYKITTAVVE